MESWSGSDNTRPQVVPSSLDFVNRGGERCARFNVVTLGDGLARIKLKAFDDRRNEILEHQFLGIWMRLGTPAIDEVGSADPTGGPAGSNTEVGDPAGDGAFLPSSDNGRVQVKVTGSFPDETAPRARSRTTGRRSPASWPSERNPTDDAPWRWDIHDDSAKTEGHVGGFCRDGARRDRRGRQLPRRRRAVLARVRRLRS